MKEKILIFAFILTIVVVCISGCDFATPETGVLYLKNSTPEALNVVVNAKNITVESGKDSFLPTDSIENVGGINSKKHDCNFFSYIKNGKVYNAVEVFFKTKYVYEISINKDDLKGDLEYYDISEEPLKWKLLDFTGNSATLEFYKPYEFEFYDGKENIGKMLIKSNMGKRCVLITDKLKEEYISVPYSPGYFYFRQVIHVLN